MLSRTWISSLAVSCFFLFAVSVPCFAAIERVNSDDIDMTLNSSSTITTNYDSGTTGTNRYSVFVIQLNINSDAVTDVRYGNTTATLLYKVQSQHAQFNNYNYFYGVSDPATSTNVLEIIGSQSIPANILAATYSGVDPDQPGITEAAGIGFASSTWSSVFDTGVDGELAVIASADNSGNMAAGSNAVKLSTRTALAGLQVWEAGPYSTAGENYFDLVGGNGNAMDVQFITLNPYGSAQPSLGIETITTGDFDHSSNTGTSFSVAYDSGTSGTRRYAVFAVQLTSTGDDVASLTYGSATATLLLKNQTKNFTSNTYDYLFGLDAPATGTHSLQVSGTAVITGYLAAVTYGGVDPAKTNVFEGVGTDQDSYTWTSVFESLYPGEVAVISTRDDNGDLVSGEETEKISSTRSASVTHQVWQGGVYLDSGTNSFELLGDNGGAFDGAYVTLGAYGLSNSSTTIQRGNVGDFDDWDSSSSTISHTYDSGTSGVDRYMVVAVQLVGSTDDVISVTYGSATATLLYKRQSSYAQFNNFNYFYGITDPASGSNTLTVNGSQAIPTYILAVTYAGVSKAAPYLKGGYGVGSQLYSWESTFDVDRAGVVAVVTSGDNNGLMFAGTDTDKLSLTRTPYGGLQVWEGGPYENGGKNVFGLSGPNGSATDVNYVLLAPSN